MCSSFALFCLFIFWLSKYHCLSLANQANFDVDFIGFCESKPCEQLLNNKHINLRHLRVPVVPSLLNHFYISRVIFKTWIQLFLLLRMLLFTITQPKYILCQTPPAIPLLAVALLVCRIRGAKLVVDWHNYGFTWLAVNRPASSILIKMHQIYEMTFAQWADYHFCVSRAMKHDLKTNWKINALVLYDHPQPFFHRSTTEEKLSLFSRHSFLGLNECLEGPWKQKQDDSENVISNGRLLSYSASLCRNDEHFMYKENNFINEDGSMKENRPALLVSSTSWTADEDFSVLLESLLACDLMARQQEPKYFPRIKLVVTGRGDLKSYFEHQISNIKLKYFQISTAFLSFADYACLLGAADLGISMHFSSSKLDLPMKVVDMFGAGCPVVAFDYGCLDELVQDGINGFTFKNDQQLGNLLFKTLRKFPKNEKTLKTMSHYIQNQTKTKSWDQAWQEVAKPVFIKA